MDKKKQIQFNLNNFLLAMSMPLDFIEAQACNTSKSHSKIVAYIALKIGLKLKLSSEEMSDLCSYSLVHNIGLFESNKKDEDYCEISEEIIERFPFLTNQENILKYQCENYDGSGLYGLKGDEIPLFSQIISFVDTIDSKFDFSKPSIENRIEIIEFVQENANKLFSKKIVDIFTDFSSETSFWLDLQNENETLYFIFGNLQDFTTVLDFEDLLEITSIFTYITDSNSLLIDKAIIMTDYYQFDHKDKLTFLIAVSLQGIGKLMIPKEILHKPSYLTPLEYEVVKSYPYYTKKILSNIIGFNDIANWACKTQESLDGQGYPFGLDASSLSLKDRLIGILNIYESLTKEQNYRQSFSHKHAIELMKEMANDGKLDIAMINDIDEVFSK